MVDFKKFNELINPSDQSLYLALSRTTSGKGMPIDFGTALRYAAADNLLELGIFLPQDVYCLEITSETIATLIRDLNLSLIVLKISNKYYIYGKGTHRNTLNNTLACGCLANTHAYARSPRAVVLPFKSPSNTAPSLKDASTIHMPAALEPMPDWLTPAAKISRTVPDLDLGFPLKSPKGDLISIFLILDKMKMQKETMIEVLSFVNDNLTEDPLEESELLEFLAVNGISKGSTEFFGPKGEFLHHKMGDYLIRELHIQRNATGEDLYFWDERKNIYITDNDTLLGLMTRLHPGIKDYERREVLRYLEAVLALSRGEFNQSPTTVVFRNGIMDVLDKELVEMTPESLETIQLQVNYNPDAKSETVDNFFETATCGNKALEQLLYEAIGYTMIKTNHLEKSFMLIGEGRNGKTTYLEIIKNLLGSANYTTVSLKDLTTTFRPSALNNKLASLAGDISGQAIQDSELIKSITSGEDILIEEKFKQAQSKALFATMFFAANKLPRSSDLSFGFYRKFCIIPFNANLDNVNRVKGMMFKKKLFSRESLEYIAYKAIDAIHNVFNTTYDFTQPKEVGEMLNRYKRENSSVLAWFEHELDSNRRRLIGHSFGPLYYDYRDWSKDNGYRSPVMAKSFTQTLCADAEMYMKDDKFVDKHEQITIDDLAINS